MENKIEQEMTALDFFNEAKRMCRSRNTCTECIMDDYDGSRCKLGLFGDSHEDIQATIEFIYNWSKEHPVRTMADVLFETFPDTKRNSNGIPIVCPQYFYNNFVCENRGTCVECKKEFWSREAPEK